MRELGANICEGYDNGGGGEDDDLASFEDLRRGSFFLHFAKLIHWKYCASSCNWIKHSSNLHIGLKKKPKDAIIAVLP